MIVDAYKSFNRVFSPSRADIESYLKVLDRNGDGRVTIQDLEDLCCKYLMSKIWSHSPSFKIAIFSIDPIIQGCQLQRHKKGWVVSIGYWFVGWWVIIILNVDRETIPWSRQSFQQKYHNFHPAMELKSQTGNYSSALPYIFGSIGVGATFCHLILRSLTPSGSTRNTYQSRRESAVRTVASPRQTTHPSPRSLAFPPGLCILCAR